MEMFYEVLLCGLLVEKKGHKQSHFLPSQHSDILLET